MNCENALELMNRELDEALTAEESAALWAHLDACPDCRETWRQLHELDALLQESELEPPAALHDGVMRAIRQEQKRKPRRAWVPAAAIAAAAVRSMVTATATAAVTAAAATVGPVLPVCRSAPMRPAMPRLPHRWHPSALSAWMILPISALARSSCNRIF